MVKSIQQTTQFMFIIYLLLPFVPYTVSFKTLLKRDASNLGGSSSGCPFTKLGNKVNSLFDLACNTLGAALFNIQEPLLTHSEEHRPEPGFYFQEPNFTANPPDQRGPCPGLNLLANYGYLPRNGIVTFDEVLEATARGFNMGKDVATALTVAAVVFTGNIATQKFSIGASDLRVGIGDKGGLDRHNNVECDISPNREDSYTGNCDNHHLSSRMFKQNVEFAKKYGGLFNFKAMTNQYAQNANYSKTNNPYLFYSPLSAIVSLGAHIFYTYLFSNGTYEYGGIPDFTTISSIVGANLTINGKDYHFQYIPERWPEINNTAGKSWYRRSFPFTLAQLLPLELEVYAANPVGIPFGQLGTSNLTLKTLACGLYSQIRQATPIIAAQTLQDVAAATTWVISKLNPIFSDTIFGCPANLFSTNGNSSLYSYENQIGSTNHSVPAACVEKTNEYYKIYFPTAPK